MQQPRLISHFQWKDVWFACSLCVVLALVLEDVRISTGLLRALRL